MSEVLLSFMSLADIWTELKLVMVASGTRPWSSTARHSGCLSNTSSSEHTKVVNIDRTADLKPPEVGTVFFVIGQYAPNFANTRTNELSDGSIRTYEIFAALCELPLLKG